MSGAVDRGIAGDDVERARTLFRERLAELAAARLESAAGDYLQVAESLPFIVWVADPDGRARYLNGRWYEYTGFDEARSVGYGWNDVIHRDDLDAAFARWTHAINTGEPLDVTYRFRRRDGQYRWHLGGAVARRDASGRVTEWIGACAEIGASSDDPAAPLPGMTPPPAATEPGGETQP